MLIKIINENAEHEHIPDYTFTRDGDVVYIGIVAQLWR